MERMPTRKFYWESVPEDEQIDKEAERQKALADFEARCEKARQEDIEADAAREKEFQNEIERLRGADYSALPFDNSEKLVEWLNGKDYLEQMIAIERAFRTDSLSFESALELFEAAKDNKTRLAVIENLPKANWDEPTKKAAMEFLAKIAAEGFDDKNSKQIDIFFGQGDELGDLYIASNYLIDSLTCDENETVFLSAPVMNLAKFGAAAEPLIVRIIENRWRYLNLEEAEGLFPDESGYEPPTADKEFVDPYYVYTACALSQLQEIGSARTAETILLAAVLKGAKEAGEKIDFEKVKNIRLEEKPIGEDLEESEKQEILEIAKENYFGDVYKDNSEVAQKVIDELETELFGIDGLKNQRTYTLKYQGRVIAFCRFKPIEGKPDELYAGSLNVYKDLRGFSIGGYFVRATTGKEAKNYILRAITRADNIANANYKKCGWAISEENHFEKNGVKYFNMTMDRREEKE